jgi:hypothetical protein
VDRDSPGDGVILVYRKPGAETFATSLTFKRGESLSLTAFPEIVFTVDELLSVLAIK